MSTLVGLIDAALNSTDPCSSPAMAAGLAKVEHRRMKSGHAPDASYQSSWFLDGEFAERELGRLGLRRERQGQVPHASSQTSLANTPS